MGGMLGGTLPRALPWVLGGALRRTLSATLFDASGHFGIARSISAIRRMVSLIATTTRVRKRGHLKKQDLTPILRDPANRLDAGGSWGGSREGHAGRGAWHALPSVVGCYRPERAGSAFQ
jgi:hypothetical protein